MILAALIASLALALAAPSLYAADAETLAAEEALLASIAVTPDELMPLALETTLVAGGQPNATICHANAPAWREAALVIQKAVAAATGVTLPVVADTELAPDDAFSGNLILLGHLDNNRHVARLYHNFFVCLDVGYTGREGYVIRSVHDPFGAGKNCILVGGSFAEGTAKAAADFAERVRAAGAQGELALGRLMELRFDRTDRAEAVRAPMSEPERDQAIAQGRRLMFSPGQGRSGVAQLTKYGTRYHRTGDPRALEAYRDLMLAFLEYYRTDEYITGDGMARYDRDFRDAWTHGVGICWDLAEESGAFSDQERLDFTNLVLRLGLECVLYQGWNRPGAVENWAANTDIVHNHNTFPALGVYFVGNYMKRHYQRTQVDDWLTVAHGIFNGQKRSSKPLEDAAGYQWLPIIHTMVYSLAEGDHTFFDEGHARGAARVAMMAMDNAGYQSAYGDHSAYKSASALSNTLQTIAWYYKDPEILWTAQHAALASTPEMDQPYSVDFDPQPATEHAGVNVMHLPQVCYDYASHSPQYPTAPNLPWEQTFDKLTLRDGLDPDGEYLLLDGFGRGTHMHFDANAIIRYSAGGEPLLVDGEYIKNTPKYHSSLVIIRDGQAALTPAVTGLGRADDLDGSAYTRTWLADYNGTEWTRSILWSRGDYLLVSDEVRALEAGDFTLRCCWRPWGDTTLEGGRLTVEHDPMRLVIDNADGAAGRVEALKQSETMPISRLSQQVSRTLPAGGTYRFMNLVYSRPGDSTEKLDVKRLADDCVAVQGENRADIIAFGAAVGRMLDGVTGDPEAVLLATDRMIAAECTALEAPGVSLSSTQPISLALSPGAGLATLSAREDAEVSVRLADGRTITVNGAACPVEGDRARITVPEGSLQISFEPFDMPGETVDLIGKLAAAKASPLETSGQAAQTAQMSRAWSEAGFEPAREILRVESTSADQEHDGRYGPVDKLTDGAFSSSTFSVKWPVGVTPTITLDLGVETEISDVVLREWHMNEAWDIGERTLEISSDGFQNDIRAVPGEFEETGTQSWGGNVNTLVSLPVNQRARQARLVVSPAREDSSVYIAEIEIHGVRPGALPGIEDISTGDLTGDGRDDVVVCSDSGEVAAFTADGEKLWSFVSDGRPALHCVECADVNGDGRAEVVYGGTQARLGLLSSEGKELWQVTLPQFRGITADVMTMLTTRLNADDEVQIVCGCKNWMFYAFDATGKKLWENVTYAHSATVSLAEDVNGDGFPEIIAGNAYYRMNLIDHKGKRLWMTSNFGPEQTAVGSIDATGDGLPDTIAGDDSGQLLCYAGDSTKLWSISLGDKVTRVLRAHGLTEDDSAHLVCAAESANVFALSADGSLLWRAPLPDGAGDLAVAPRAFEQGGPRLLATAGSAGIVQLDATGKTVALGATDGRAKQVVLCEGRAIVTTDSGVLSAFDMRDK